MAAGFEERHLILNLPLIWLRFTIHTIVQWTSMHYSTLHRTEGRKSQKRKKGTKWIYHYHSFYSYQRVTIFNGSLIQLVFYKKKKKRKKTNISFWICLDYQLLYNWEKCLSTEKTWQGPTQTSKYPLARPDLFIYGWRKRLKIKLVSAEGEADWKPKFFQGGWEDRRSSGPSWQVSGGREDLDGGRPAVSEPQMGLVFDHVSVEEMKG